MKTCRQCQNAFSIDSADEAYYKKIDVPAPTLCPKCRLQRRLAFRNERNLYKRKCDKSGRDIIANIRPNAPFPVFHVEEWHKDDWDSPQLPSYDFSKSFFEQFAQLSAQAPRMHKASGGNEVNSEYTNHAGNCKNCYFIFNTEYAEDCLYLRFADHCRDSVDCTNAINCELCYECVNIENCYNLRWSDDCKTSRDSYFLRNCRGMEHSIFCYGLEQKKFHIFNEPHTKEEYEAKIKELKLHTYSGLQKAAEIWKEWSKQFPMRRQILQNCEGSTGDSLFNCKNAKDCYNGVNLEDCRYVINAVRVKDSYDVYAYGEAELSYEHMSAFKNYNMKFCCLAINCSDCEYCETCWGCKNCFGCVGLRGKSYCVFNKQYPKEEYFDLVKRIKEKMRADGEYGEFFPMELSPFPYEDTLANDYFPIKQKESPPPAGIYEETSGIPDDISYIDAYSLLQKIYLCPETNRLFKFQKQELDFYKNQKIPLPRVCFEARYKKRNMLVPFPY